VTSVYDNDSGASTRLRKPIDPFDQGGTVERRGNETVLDIDV
jgi:hypothetical protein